MLDSASSVIETFTLSLHVTDLILIFIRWTRQHFEGTMKVMKMLNMLEEMDEEIPIPKLIASVEPNIDELKKLSDEVFALSLENSIQDNKDLLTEQFDTKGEIFYSIPEIIELKRQESILSYHTSQSIYDRLATKIVTVTDN